MVPATTTHNFGGCAHSQRKPTHKFCNECGALLPSPHGLLASSTPAAPPVNLRPAPVRPPAQPGASPPAQFGPRKDFSKPEARARAATGPTANFAQQQQRTQPPVPARQPQTTTAAGSGAPPRHLGRSSPTSTSSPNSPSHPAPLARPGYARTQSPSHTATTLAAYSPPSQSLARSSPPTAVNARSAGWSASPSSAATPPPSVPARSRPMIVGSSNGGSGGYGGSASAPVSTYNSAAAGGFSLFGGSSSTSPDQRYISAPQPSTRPGESEMTKEERELKKLLREVEKEKERVLQEERLKQREKEFEKEEEQYTKEKQRDYIQKLNAGKLEMGQRESVYVHQKKDAPVLTLQLLDETIIEKHNSQTYTLYRIRVTWGDCVWTIQRRYSQFSDFHKSVKWKTNVKLPYPLPGKKLIGSLEDEVVEQRKVGLRQYLKGVEERQMELVNNEKYEQLFIRFVGPFQLGDTKDHVPGNKMPFKVKL
ncbi:PX domain containing protein [Acanthamoeba castellanii str. Neff]|uniref:PX domain containing protein n=1 Tax=Acanthamoeba castellanii (strain ATCC 30010 / Neff) TaxID=1257118 RepID=L8H1K2_ACACF|nr:PX domain containing protein [Acanthamoeba castellanii str. Neff]ELR19394.1 PX domain containing protein [Acanthamoeba castellanii str. Neff]